VFVPACIQGCLYFRAERKAGKAARITRPGVVFGVNVEYHVGECGKLMA
jgi:hypothetical protein